MFLSLHSVLSNDPLTTTTHPLFSFYYSSIVLLLISSLHYHDFFTSLVLRSYIMAVVCVHLSFLCSSRVAILLQYRVPGGGACCHGNSLRLRPPLTPPPREKGWMREGRREGEIAPALSNTSLPTNRRERRTRTRKMTKRS